jgi:hypothetical protein
MSRCINSFSTSVSIPFDAGHEANLAILVVSASSDRKLMVGELGK